MLTEAFGESTISRKEVQLRFKKGRDNARSGRPSTSTSDEHIEAVKKISLDNRRISTREIADDIGISLGSYQANNMIY